ncbi:hypothetical protein FB451DRAFT_223490 [Mycena latifolia]|nr:hypothetical protein FB451DRAFT_223490 [Mycena latifolia]
MASTLLSIALLVFAGAVAVRAESHTVKFDNRQVLPTLELLEYLTISGPQLIKGGDVLTTTSYTSTGELAAAIAYLQTGSCGFNGEQCTLLELTMTNPVAVGSGSSADISLITPVEFYGGCDGVGTTCDSPGCSTAFKQPDDTWVQVACQENNANLLITFCPDGSSAQNTTVQHSATTTTAKAKTTTSSKISPTLVSATRSSTPTTAASSSSTSPSPSLCKHKRSERRAINAHRKRGPGRSFPH